MISLRYPFLFLLSSLALGSVLFPLLCEHIYFGTNNAEGTSKMKRDGFSTKKAKPAKYLQRQPRQLAPVSGFSTSSSVNISQQFQSATSATYAPGTLSRAHTLTTLPLSLSDRVGRPTSSSLGTLSSIILGSGSSLAPSTGLLTETSVSPSSWSMFSTTLLSLSLPVPTSSISYLTKTPSSNIISPVFSTHSFSEKPVSSISSFASTILPTSSHLSSATTTPISISPSMSMSRSAPTSLPIRSSQLSLFPTGFISDSSRIPSITSGPESTSISTTSYTIYTSAISSIVSPNLSNLPGTSVLTASVKTITLSTIIPTPSTITVTSFLSSLISSSSVTSPSLTSSTTMSTNPITATDIVTQTRIVSGQPKTPSTTLSKPSAIDPFDTELVTVTGSIPVASITRSERKIPIPTLLSAGSSSRVYSPNAFLCFTNLVIIFGFSFLLVW
ncbi:uncharacterized protein VTP21DRAFT_1326 [Calcarisporiella thermophila]|uniref:uncharacterized protein n=1 Tax=Calcarisporiella thermophila TaxID=911321 RepID=UPI00374243EF